MTSKAYSQTQRLRGLTGDILRDQIHRELVYRAFQFHERRQHFVRTHDETLFVAMRVRNPDRSPFQVDS